MQAALPGDFDHNKPRYIPMILDMNENRQRMQRAVYARQNDSFNRG